LAAIQGLHEALKEKDAQIESLHRDVTELKSLVNTLIKKTESAQGKSFPNQTQGE
jgi:hypothetical protein